MDFGRVSLQIGLCNHLMRIISTYVSNIKKSEKTMIYVSSSRNHANILFKLYNQITLYSVCSVHWGDTMSLLGGTMSLLGGYHEYIGGVQYIGGI